MGAWKDGRLAIAQDYVGAMARTMFKKKKKSRLISLVMLCGYHVPLSPITHDKKGLWKICGYFPPNP